MNRLWIGALCAVVAACATTPAVDSGGSTLNAKARATVRAATFEVVVPKVEAESVTYERPLPLDLLPFGERNDKYHSIGTAFAIAPGKYVTAAHVFLPLFNSDHGTPALRDASGHVYDVAEVVKYSSDEDFAVFTVKDGPADAAVLEAGNPPALNDTVYAVGNALGEGIVIRDGVYTSDTPENRDGRWKWLRFSAAASPGNSGGPLVDRDGKVVGVVLAKSPSENLNFALPIDRVKSARDNAGVLNDKQTYQLDVFDDVDTDTSRRELALPMTFQQLDQAYMGYHNDMADLQLARLLKNADAKTFPHGSGSHKALSDWTNYVFPSLLVRQSDGGWAPSPLDKKGAAQLGDNGVVSVALVRRNILVHVRRPDSVAARDFYSDSRLFMDLILKALPLTRTVGPEKVRITSLGKAATDTTHVDAYGRPWQLREWRDRHENAVLALVELPTPDGAVALLRVAPMLIQHDTELDLLAMTNFMSAAFAGTLQQWQEFLQAGVQLPRTLADLKLTAGTDFSLRTRRLSLAFGKDVLTVTPRSWLALQTSFFEDHGVVTWDAAAFVIREDPNSKDRVQAWRVPEPYADVGDPFKSKWDEMIARKHPYDGEVQNKDDETSIKTVVPAGGASGSKLIYVVEVARNGTVPSAEMKKRVKLAAKGVRFREGP